MYISFQVLSLPNCMKHIVCESAYCSTFPCTDFKLYNAHRDNVELTVHDCGADEMETDYLYFLAACKNSSRCWLEAPAGSSTEKLAAASGRRRWPICWCCLHRGPGSFDVEDATTLSWSSAAVSEWVQQCSLLSLAKCWKFSDVWQHDVHNTACRCSVP